MEKIKIYGEYIELYKLLKLAGLCATGGEAKIVISEGMVNVDGEIETRKRRKIKPGMEVEYSSKKISVSFE